jgi:hypothetical protein
MTIVRAPRPANHFTQIRNDVLRDDRLSYRARGVLAVILSRPDGWATSTEALQREGTEGRDAIRTALSELEDAGYLVREKRQDDRGRWATVVVVYDAPKTDGQMALPVEPPMPENPSSVNRRLETRPSVSQALSTNTDDEQSPTGSAAKADAPAAVIAKAVYDGAEGMINFMAVRQIAGRALKIKPTPTPEAIQATMLALYREGRPITLTTVGQALSKRTGISDTNDDHWRKGGEF